MRKRQSRLARVGCSTSNTGHMPSGTGALPWMTIICRMNVPPPELVYWWSKAVSWKGVLPSARL